MLLLTGGLGFIGSHIAAEYITHTSQTSVLILDDMRNSFPHILQTLQTMTRKNIIFHQVDLCDEESLRIIFNEYDITEIIHCAGLKAVGESVQDPLYYYHTNLTTTLNLLKMCEQFKTVQTFIFSSSATVYGTPQQNPIPLSHPKQPSSPYGRTKSMIEDILTDFAAVHPEIRILLLRYFNPVGAHPSGLLGDNPSSKPNNLFPAILHCLQGKMKKLTIFKAPGADDTSRLQLRDETGIRDYIYIQDLAIAHIRSLFFQPKPDDPRGNLFIWNVGSGNGFSVLEVVAEFEKQLGHPIPKLLTEPRPGDVAICVADVSQWEADMQWVPSTPLADCVRTTLQYIENHTA